MRILHTADWHLGRILHGVRLTDDQAYVLEQLVSLAKETRPDAIIIAGDVYDRALPPPDAVALLSDTLARLTAETRAHVIIISGNHDSATRLGFGAELLRAARVHVHARFSPAPEPLTLEDAHGPVRIWPLPYADPALARSVTKEKSIATHEDMFAHLLAGIRMRIAELPKGRDVLCAHATVLGAESATDAADAAERPLSIGGAEAVPPDLFAGFHYVALGHLHRAQQAGAEHIRYAGSPLKYSSAEVTHEKSVTLVEMDAHGAPRVEILPLTPRRDLRVISGTLRELLAAARRDPAREDYVMAELLDPRPVPDPKERLREHYPNILTVRFAGLKGAAGGAGDARRELLERAARSPLDLFADFHAFVTDGEKPDDETLALMRDVIGAVERRRREDAA